MSPPTLYIVSAIIYIVLGGSAVFIIMDWGLCLGFYFCKKEPAPPRDQDRFFYGAHNVPADKLEEFVDKEWERHNARWVMDHPTHRQYSPQSQDTTTS